MAQEIKFRGKSVNNGKWLYGYLGEVKGKVLQRTYREKVIFENLEWFNTDNFGYVVNDYMVEEETIGQFTGLYDKDGREVYEHDYVSINYKYDRPTLNGVIPDQDCFCEGEIVYMEGLACFGIRLYKAEYPMIEELNSNHYITLPLINFSLECEDIEVFGNIFDNPNLINKQIMQKKEFQIGELFQYGLVKMICKKADEKRLCYDCDFYDLHNECCVGDFVGECSSGNREDKTDVIFVKVED